MNHLDEGEIQAFLDGQPSDEERAVTAEHLISCESCRSVHDELGRTRSLIASSVPLLDRTAPTVERQGRKRAPRRARASTAMVWAAGLVLLLAAAVAAVPGSPVRDWVVQVAERALLPGSPDPAPVPQGAEEGAVIAVVGTVRGSGGEPLAFARVSVMGDTVSGWADEAGAYRLEGRARDRWAVRVAHPGYRPVERSVRLPASGPLPLDFLLDPLPGPAPAPLADFRPIAADYTLPALLNAAEVTATIEALYPLDLADRQVGGEAVLRLWLDENGRVARSALAGSSGQPRLDSIALSVSRDMRFRPAKIGDDGVRVIVQIPVLFAPGAPGDGG